MGITGSKRSRRRAVNQAPDEVVVTDPDPLAKCVVSALQSARETPARLSDLPFDKLLLKFPAMRQGFKQLHKAFHQPSTAKPEPSGITGVGAPTGIELFRMTPSGSDVTQMETPHKPECEGTISQEEGKKALAALGFNISQAELDQAFAAVTGPKEGLELSYSDFVVGLCVLVLRMGAEKAKAEGADEEAVDAIKLSVDSFAHFDKDGNGYLFKDEVLTTLAEVDKPAHARSKSRPPGNTLQQRWQQMDWDHDGRVGLREYLMSLHSWVMEDLEEDES